MFIAPLNPGARLRLAAFAAGLALLNPLAAQQPLVAGTYTQAFDGLAGGLPAGWTVYTGATASASGTPATLTTAATSWASTTGAWRNSAAADAAGLTAASSTADQSAAADRALGIRQTGSFGDPGASAAFNFSTTGLQVTAVSFSAQMLSVQPRSTTWSLQYALGAAPTTWTTLATFSDPGAFGATVVNAAGLGTALDNQPNAWLRVVALSASTGTGNRDTFGVDDFTIVTVAGGGGGTAPEVTDDPDNATVAAGGTAVFSVAATGTAPLSYQWRKNTAGLADGGNVAGATTATLTLTNVQAADEGSYDVVVTNAHGSDTSAAATLDVEVPVPPTVTDDPDPVTVNVGGLAVFSVTATGTAPLSYQWLKNGANVTAPNATGATTATLTLTNVQAGDAGSYSVVVTNGAGTDTSAAAALTVNAPELYWDLGAANFTQDWSAAGLVTANDNWSGVPSVIGYLGQDLTTSTGADPQALLGTSTVANDVDVIANQSNPNTLSSGGVAEFDGIPNPTIALQGSGTADAPHLVIHLNTLGRTGITVAYNLRDLDGSADNSAQPVALQYRVGDTGSFTNVPAAFVADATTGPSQATQVTPVSAVLPADADNQPKVQVRLMTTNAVGNDEWVGLDDLVVSSVHDGVPRVFVSHTSDATLVNEAGPTTDTYRLRLNTAPAGAVTVRATADAQTEVSADGVTFGATADVVFTDTLPRTVTVRAINDATNEAAIHFSTIGHAVVASGDAGYPVGFAIAALTAGVEDDDGGTGLTRIHAIQGGGAASPLAGYQVTISGVVTGFFTGGTGTRDGVYVQEEDAEADADPATSEGIYVFFGGASPHAAAVAALNVGDLIVVTGKAAEFNNLTEVTDVLAVATAGTAALPTPQAVTLPLPSTTFLERYEGMRVTFGQALTVTDNFDLGHFGQIILSNGRLPQPTNVVAPGAPAQAQALANRLNQVVLDDGTSRSYPDPTPYLFDDGSGATLRAGDSTTGVSGVLTYQFGLYMVEPSAPPVFTRGTPRPASPPAVGGSLKVSIGNVLNLFNGDGAGGGFPTARGADSFAEYQRQLDKVVAGILGHAPDIMGLTEVENDGYGPASALAQLVAALNAAAPAGTTYAYVDAGAVDIVTDLIHSAFIYRTQTVETVGAPAMLSSPYFNNHARNPLAQTFRQKSTGAVLTVSINHFRAKASVSSMTDGIVPNPNIDQGDGQGTNNWLRTKEAEALVQWLATDPTGSGDPDFLIIGDLNAYAKEDPITAIKNAGYVDLTHAFEGAGGYSYSFDGQFGHLDHALASASLAAQVTGAGTWHVNSDEPIYLDYNTEDKSAAQQALNVGTAYRYSDHDPVLVGFNLHAPPVIGVQPQSQTVTVGDGVTFTVGATGVPAPTYQWRKGGAPIAGATGPSYTIASAVTADAGSYDVVVTNVAGSATSSAAVLTVNKAVAAVTLGGLATTYNGAPQPVTVTTVPAGLTVAVTYAGSPTAPANAGSYAVEATVVDADYTGSAAGTLVIAKATASVALGGLSQTYDGTPKSATVATTPAGLTVAVTYNGVATAPTGAGSYAVEAVVNDANHAGSATGTLVIAPATATVALAGLVHAYDGTPHPAVATTTPAGLPVTLTYDGGPTPPTYPGAYAVVATIADPNHAGTAADTLVITVTALVRHAPGIGGGVDGSVQVLLPEDITLGGGAWIADDLLVPGTPATGVNGGAVLGGTLDGPGAAAPAGHTVTLNGNAALGRLVRRIDPIALPVVPPPPPPAGATNVTISNSLQPAPNWATLRNLTLNNAPLTIPPGTYGALVGNGRAIVRVGIAGATTPAVYNLQSLTLNGTSRLQVLGPVIINVANGASFAAAAGDPAHPDWLELNLAAGGLTLNGSGLFSGYVAAPAGTVALNGSCTLRGGVACDQLVLNGNALLDDPEL